MRQLLALACGTISGYLLGKWFGLDFFSIYIPSSGVFLQRELSLFFILGMVAGTVTPLISWKHTPGLPAMTFSLIITFLGLSADPRLDPAEARETGVFISYAFDSILVISVLLMTYALAWFTDTRIVFRTLPVQPQQKKADVQTVLLRMMPCCLLNIVGGVIIGFIMPLSGAISIFISFCLIAFLSSYLFKVRSTLWYSISVPVYLSFVGFLILSRPDLISVIIPQNWIQGCPSLLICGSGSAGALLGNRLWMIHTG
jgi:hypothetical protein